MTGDDHNTSRVIGGRPGIRRRGFVRLAAGAAIVPPAVARAQQQPMRVIGQLNPGLSNVPAAVMKPYLDAVREGLSESGYVEGQNVRIEWRFADGHFDRLPALAAELVALKVDAIETNSAIGALTAKNATSIIPIVFNGIGDPVRAGLVASLAHPGGNITGVTDFAGQLAPKFLDLLTELVPGGKAIGLLVNPTAQYATEFFTRTIGEAASAKGINLTVQKASTPAEIDTAYAAFAQARLDALISGGDVLFLAQHDQLVALAARYSIPEIYYNVLYVRAGGLICYGVDEVAGCGRAFYYVGKILNGANPAEMPVERPTKFILAVNLKAAAQLGLTVPPSILAQATEVIE